MSFFQALGRLFEGEKPKKPNPVKTQPIVRVKSTGIDMSYKSAVKAAEVKASLVIQLQECRVSIARREGIKPYMVFTDRQLMSILESEPINERELSWIEGFEEEKASKYGKEITKIFRYR